MLMLAQPLGRYLIKYISDNGTARQYGRGVWCGRREFMCVLRMKFGSNVIVNAYIPR